MKKIGVLTSGGDAPGMNPTIRSIVRFSIFNEIEIVGIKHGYEGLIDKEFIKMDRSSVADIIQRGGTILFSSRSKRFLTKKGREKAYKNLRKENIEGIIVIGGNGSLKGVQKINEESHIKAIGIPGTIDNDLSYTDYTIGFDTALNNILDAINKVRDTATSHQRTFVIECMGRNSGSLATMAGLAGGAEIILIPEKKINLNDITSKIMDGYKKGKLHSIILVAEGIKDPQINFSKYNNSPGIAIGDIIKEKTKLDTRVTILGHLQRGGSPTGFDRIMGSEMGAKAVELLMLNKKNKMVNYLNNSIGYCDIKDALMQVKNVNEDIYTLAHKL